MALLYVLLIQDYFMSDLNSHNLCSFINELILINKMSSKNQLIQNAFEDDNDDNIELDNSIDIFLNQTERSFKAICLKSLPKTSKLSSSLLETEPITWKSLYQKLFRPMLNNTIKPKNGSYLTLEEIELRLKLLFLQLDSNSIFTIGKANVTTRKNKSFYSKLQREKNNDIPSIISLIEDKTIYKKNDQIPIIHSRTRKSLNGVSQTQKESKKRLSLINSLSHCSSMFKSGDLMRVKKMRTNGSIIENSGSIKKKVIPINKSILMKSFEELKANYNKTNKIKEISTFLDFNHKERDNVTIFVDNTEKRIHNLIQMNKNECMLQMEYLFKKIKNKFGGN